MPIPSTGKDYNILSADGQKTIQTRLFQHKWHMGFILRRWRWILVSSAEGNAWKQSKRKQRNSDNTTDADTENSDFLNCCWQNPEIQMTGFWMPYTGGSTQTKATRANRGILKASNVKKIPQRTLAFGFSVLFAEWWHKDSRKTDLDTERLTYEKTKLWKNLPRWR